MNSSVFVLIRCKVDRCVFIYILYVCVLVKRENNGTRDVIVYYNNTMHMILRNTLRDSSANKSVRCYCRVLIRIKSPFTLMSH